MDEVKKYLACEGRASVIIANTTELVEEYRKEQKKTYNHTEISLFCCFYIKC